MVNNLRVGTDIIEIKRLQEKPIEKNLRFYNTIFTESEINHCKRFKNPYPHFAGIFTAKEAVKKCVNHPLLMSNIHLSWDKNGKPSALIFPDRKTIEVSISHTNKIAIAISIIFVS